MELTFVTSMKGKRAIRTAEHDRQTLKGSSFLALLLLINSQIASLFFTLKSAGRWSAGTLIKVPISRSPLKTAGVSI
jgi:hypothetical protein